MRRSPIRPSGILPQRRRWLDDRNLGRVRAALARLDDQGFRYALADEDGHFPCPACGDDQLLLVDE